MISRLDFVKYEGCGNDFIIVDELGAQRTRDELRSSLAVRLCKRHIGVGADGLIFIEAADGTDGSMRLFEPAGNEADMCGNGLRCVASYIHEITAKNEMDILTKDGVKHVSMDGDEFTVDMGVVRTQRESLSQYMTDEGSPEDSMLDTIITVQGEDMRASVVNSGEPHVVVFTDHLESVDVVGAGVELNADKSRFPSGMNINFVQRAETPGHISVRTYERGVYDETMACGTGATACAVTQLLRSGKSEGTVHVQARGGSLVIELISEGRAFMTGPARRVFHGTAEVDL
jgi:diaminopimelate epimerase